MQEAQSEKSREKNRSFFAANAGYQTAVHELDSYANMPAAINAELAGINRLIDIGNGGVFLYDTHRVREVVAYDLFFDEASAGGAPPPDNVVLKAGSALALPEPDNSCDGVLMVMLLHHVIGATVAQSHANLGGCIREAARILRPEGRLIVVESCVPVWLYRMERAGFRVARPVVEASLKHPMTFQYTREVVEERLRGAFPTVRTTEIPLGRYVIQLGFRFPAWLTPVRVWKFVALKRRDDRELTPPAGRGGR